ncbi:DUF5107 domain-containing protein [Paenarthrobacter sp. Z7-10]|nr:DUF5107 domain-containing protein [Paenarthrobacter sp. Z7-10]
MADPGVDSKLPMLSRPAEAPEIIGSTVPQDIVDGSRFGNPAHLYPYQAQDGYDRVRTERSLRTVVLENDRLRAVFLPELGGRLWELFDKAAGKPLLYTPPSIQFANLALRSAWFAGGIEWNIGTRGHAASTCSPLHTAIVRTPDGQDVLRMWEFDRLRQTVFQIDAWLPVDSAVLFVAVRIRNPNPEPVPMYWWTNAAVPEAAGSRVIAPGTSAFATEYGTGISRVQPSDVFGVDCTWPARNPRAVDFFFDLAPGRRHWIVNADDDGDGLAMISTSRLRGRKLFVWGQGPGGQRWQDWLSPDGGRYAEIQTGLAQTQFEHLAMPAGAEWSWLEAYGNAAVDAGAAHGTDFGAAIGHCERRIDALLDPAALEAAHHRMLGWADLAPERMVLSGSGWGALESARRLRHSLPWLEVTGTPFGPETIDAGQRPWLNLLTGHGFDGADTFVSGADWETLLARAEQSAPTLLHRAVLAHSTGEAREARRFYAASIQQEDNAQARRGLALLELADRHCTEGLDHYAKACALLPAAPALLAEAVAAFLGADAAAAALALISAAGPELRRLGRIRYLEALALSRSGDREAAAGILAAGVEVPDLREGENFLAELWQQVFPGQDLPAQYQFSMSAGVDPDGADPDGADPAGADPAGVEAQA